ncbi:exonuclease SbcCD subunit D [Reinekea sp.]|jgi:exonuclease SbcD|uniref:exonuclease SbcCD subunit D n=1 Tax=Reinekea sp. TaxID=1970455 RepID=UPI00398A384A
MRILHTSDWHIGRQFHNLNLLEDQKDCIDQLIDVLKNEAIDLLLIAGDIYDRSVPPAEAVVLLHNTLSVVCLELGITIAMISGNHDGPERLGFGADLLKASGLHIFTDITAIAKPLKISKGEETVNVYGIPYCQPEHVRKAFDVDVKTFDEAHTFLVEQVTKQMNPDEVNILMSHCFVGGSQVSESERPLSIGGADTVSWQPMRSFDYVALGHLHAPQFRGEEHIRYSGSLMKYSFSEVNQKKGVTVVELQRKTKPTIDFFSIKQKHDLRVIEGQFETILSDGFKDENKEDYLLIRLVDKESIIDAIGKLRSIYPNILHLEKTGVVQAANTKQVTKEHLKRSELELFADFYQKTLDEKLSEPQRQILETLINDLHAQDDAS